MMETRTTRIANLPSRHVGACRKHDELQFLDQGARREYSLLKTWLKNEDGGSSKGQRDSFSPCREKYVPHHDLNRRSGPIAVLA